MGGNFSFLSDLDDNIKKLADFAELYLYSDSHSCMFKIGLFAEVLVKKIYLEEGLKYKKYEQYDKRGELIKILLKKGYIDEEIEQMFLNVRHQRNKAAHSEDPGPQKFTQACKACLPVIHFLAVWFHRKYRDKSDIPAEYILPQNPNKKNSYEKRKRGLPAVNAEEEISPIQEIAKSPQEVSDTKPIALKIKKELDGTSVEREFYGNGALKSETTYKDGFLEGFSRAYDEDGNLVSEIEFKQNLQNGVEKGFYPGGGAEFVTPYRGGCRHGVMLHYYENGKVREETP
ncbi:MAG: hypothetical protein LBD73_02870, partial [Deferribacteraceae bacterium]|nr:hypothetical protein [Deferribacteraceae bacterium]